jgi:hypothetical protein
MAVLSYGGSQLFVPSLYVRTCVRKDVSCTMFSVFAGHSRSADSSPKTPWTISNRAAAGGLVWVVIVGDDEINAYVLNCVLPCVRKCVHTRL